MCMMNKKRVALCTRQTQLSPHTPFLQVNGVLISNWIYHKHMQTYTKVGSYGNFRINFLQKCFLYASTKLRAADFLVASQFSAFFGPAKHTRRLLCAYLTQPFTLLFTFRFSFSLPLVVAFVSCWHAFSIFFRSRFLLLSYWKKRNFRHALNHMRHVWL